MGTRAIYDDELHAHFITFSCFHRRRLLDHDQAKRVVLGVLNSQLASRGASCVGFVVMPDHVHAIVWLPTPGRSVFPVGAACRLLGRLPVPSTLRRPPHSVDLRPSGP